MPRPGGYVTKIKLSRSSKLKRVQQNPLFHVRMEISFPSGAKDSGVGRQEVEFGAPYICIGDRIKGSVQGRINQQPSCVEKEIPVAVIQIEQTW